MELCNLVDDASKKLPKLEEDASMKIALHNFHVSEIEVKLNAYKVGMVAIIDGLIAKDQETKLRQLSEETNV